MPTPKRYVAKSGRVTWQVRIRINGRQTSETFPNKTQAEIFCRDVDLTNAARAVAKRNREDRASDDYVPTLREWYATVMANKTGITDGTRQDYDRLANRVMLPLLG